MLDCYVGFTIMVSATSLTVLFNLKYVLHADQALKFENLTISSGEIL
jgi:hypothetical protein